MTGWLADCRPALRAPDRPGVSWLSRTVIPGNEPAGLSRQIRVVIDDEKHLRRTGVLAEHGFRCGAGLGPAPLGIGADDHAYVQLVMVGVTRLAVRTPIYSNHLLPTDDLATWPQDSGNSRRSP